jgi:hypothetical protein
MLRTNWIGHSLFTALRQNRVSKVIFGRSSFFAPKAQKKMNVKKMFSEYDFDAKRQRVSALSSSAISILVKSYAQESDVLKIPNFSVVTPLSILDKQSIDTPYLSAFLPIF